MKTMIKNTAILLFAGFIFTFFSCENPIALGGMLDVNGPIVNITSPYPRQAVTAQFTLEGNASDASGVKTILIKASQNRDELQIQWRYNNGTWEISETSGSTWAPYSNASWTGDSKTGEWTIDIDLSDPLDLNFPPDGEYVFSVQAWDVSGFSDDNSFKTIVLIIDKNPPKVSVSNPYLYDRYAAYSTVYDAFYYNDNILNPYTELNDLHKIADNSDAWRDPAMIGRFQTQGFRMQWQIEENHDIWSFDLRFYDVKDPDIASISDQDPSTPLPNSMIYSFNQNLGPPPEEPAAESYLKPNGSVRVPYLNGDVKDYGEQGRLHKQVTEKTTIVVIASCYDAANNANNEKILGYFIYWPKADTPWIEYSGDMVSPYGDPAAVPPTLSDSIAKALSLPENKAELDELVFMIYPGRAIKAMAYHAHGVASVEYRLYECDQTGNANDGYTISLPDYNDPTKLKGGTSFENEANSFGVYSTNFSWEFYPPAISAYYVVKATALNEDNKISEEEVAIFRVQDITYPDFVEPPSPAASDPLFRSIDTKDNSITISGIVSDATQITSLTLVWINPQSEGYAAMAQLEYFRDAQYKGWTVAKELEPGGASAIENYHSTYGNRLWNVAVTHEGEDYDTQRQLFGYSHKILLEDLNIFTGEPDSQPLRSQVFLLRAENPDGRTTIITYTPQGDTIPPRIAISYVLSDENAATHNPTWSSIETPPINSQVTGKYGVIEPLSDGDTIAIVGTWSEDSTGYLSFDEHLKDNFSITVNQIPIINAFEFSEFKYEAEGGGTGPTSGIWMVKAVVGSQIQAVALQDALVVSAKLTDIGDTPEAEAGASWLIRSDNLRLLRISSSQSDQTYGLDSKIGIFLEFNKPVQLTYTGNPELQLSIRTNSSGANNDTTNPFVTARYRDNQTQAATQQFFDYVVGPGNNTPVDGNGDPSAYLDVTGLIDGGAGTPITGNYAFTWHNVTGSDREEVRIVTTNGQNGTTTAGTSSFGGPVYLRTLPTTTSNEGADVSLTLANGKNISIDTTAPTITRIYSSNPAGNYSTGSEIYIDVVFSERVRINNQAMPSLTFNNVANGGTASVSTSTSDVKVNGNTITFKYTALDNHTTNGAILTVSGYLGTITDIAGNSLAANGVTSLSLATRQLNGGTADTGNGIYIDTIKPGTPLLKILSAGSSPHDSTDNVVSNLFATSGTTVYGHSNNQTSAVETVVLSNVYNTNLWFGIDGKVDAGAHKLQYLEYSLNNGADWTRASPNANSTSSFITEFPRVGAYTVITRQVDRAGNVSDMSRPVSLNWDPGDLITRIDSEDANGVYTNSTSRGAETINIDVYFRKTVTYRSGSITTNVTPTGSATLSTSTWGTNNNMRFAYTVGASDNTPTGANLDVTGSTLTVTDGEGVVIGTTYISVPAAGNSLRLNERKAISVQTGALNVNSWQTTGVVRTNSGDDEWQGTITLDFDRPISKGSGEVIITQVTTDNAYRLPAVLTESQASRYSGARNFNTYYTKGTNGFNSTTDAADTSAKYILSYAQTTVVTPNDGGSAIEQLAYDFHEAEIVTLSVSSNDIAVSSPTTTTGRMVITLRDSNALQVLGASYTIEFNGGFVQDSLGYQWPPVATTLKETYNYTFGGINRPFVRIDKKVNADRITAPTGSATSPALLADYSGVLQAAAKLDCRTPGSVIRYATTEVAHGVGVTADPTLVNNTSYSGNAFMNEWANNTSPPSLTAPTIATATVGVATNTAMNIGNTDYDGYAWRIRTASRSSSGGTDSTNAYDEVAYRTVLTYVVTAPTVNTLGQVIGSGDQLWLRGGDAIGSSTTPGFPFTWTDDYGSLKNDARRAGTRLMEMYQVGTSMNASSRWRYVTWEINDNAYIEILLGKSVGQTANNAWQYGATIWAKPRGGWAPARDFYPLVPGRHRWLSHTNGDYSPGGPLNWSVSETGRINTAASDVTYTQPSP